VGDGSAESRDGPLKGHWYRKYGSRVGEQPEPEPICADPQSDEVSIPAEVDLPWAPWVGGGMILLCLIGAGWALLAVGDWIKDGLVSARRAQLADARDYLNQPARPPSMTEAVTVCDLNMKAQTFAPSAYRAEGAWTIDERDGLIAIRRGFSARNPMGVDIAGAYTCLVGASTNRLIGLQFEIGGHVTTVPGSALRQ
jgi:hypothetical protein